MIDKLCLVSNKRLESKKREQLLGIWPHHQVRRTAHYDQVDIFFREAQASRHLVSIYSMPTEMNIAPLKIEINPSKSQSIFETIDTLKQITSIKNLIIRRIDHAVDVPIAVKKIHEQILVPRKKSREVWHQNTLTGVYIGKYPERICIYDKARESMSSDIKTRIELQQWSAKVAIQTLDDFEFLATYCPFKPIQFINLNQTYSIKEKAFLFHLYSKELGAQGAYKELNRHGNFKRDYRKILESSLDLPNLNDLYQQNIREFING